MPTAKNGVYAVNLYNNGGSFATSGTMLLTAANKDYFFLSGIGSISFSVQSDNDATHPFYTIRMVMSAAGSTGMLYAVVSKFT
jgi:hypothetical protein